MTVETQTEKIIIPGNGAATSFSFSPIVMTKVADIIVITKVIATGVETTRVQGVGPTNWSTTLAATAYPTTGSITYPADLVTPLPATEEITIKRVLKLEQLTDLENQGGYFPDVLENQLDDFVMIDLQQQEELGRTLQVPPTEVSISAIPSVVGRKGRVLAFDPVSGDPVVSTQTTAAIEAGSTNAAASAAAAALSASASAADKTAADADVVSTNADVVNAGNSATAAATAAASAAASGAVWCGTATGTADAIVLTSGLSLTIYTTGMKVRWQASVNANTTAMTINLDAIGAKAAELNDAALVAGDHAASKYYEGLYDGTAFQITQISSAKALLAANNLSDLASAATARTNLGLVIGTDVLAPTGDGSGLTGIVTGATTAQKTNILLNTFQTQVNGGLAAQGMTDVYTDEFVDQTGVDVATSTNETWNAAGYYVNFTLGVTDSIPLMTSNTLPSGTAAASADNAGVNPAYLAFDNATATWWDPNTGTFPNWLSYTFTAAKTIGQYTLTADGTVFLTAPGTFTFEYYNGAAWVVLDTQVTQVFAANEKKTYAISSPVSATQYRINITATADGTWNTIYEMEMMENVVANMTLQSVAAIALAQPDTAFMVLRQEDVDAVTLNTDLTVAVSRDGGTTWTAGTLADVGTLTTGRVLTSSIDISAQPAGTSMKWRAKTLNLKSQKIHAVGIEWG